MRSDVQLCLEQLGITYPIIQAPMAGGATTPELVAAVSNAGGLGSLGAGYLSAAAIQTAIQAIRARSQRPFAVNLFIPATYHVEKTQMQQACLDLQQCAETFGHAVRAVKPPYAPDFAEQMAVVVAEKVPVFSFTFGLLDPYWVEQLKKQGTILLGTATTRAEAEALADTGVDMVVLQGAEAGGHRGSFLAREEDSLVSLSTLLLECQCLGLPMIAAGALMHGHDIADKLKLGAVAVQMGTAFLSCSEFGIAETYKAALLSQEQDNTTLTRVFSGKLARGIHNRFIERMRTCQSAILDYPVQNSLTQPLRLAAKKAGNTDYQSLWAGQGVAFSRAMTAAQLMARLVDEMRQ